jgi:hypothetical protein
VDDLAVLGDDGTSLESGSTKECLSVKDESGSGSKDTLVITDCVGVSLVILSVWDTLNKGD